MCKLKEKIFQVIVGFILFSTARNESTTLAKKSPILTRWNISKQCG